MKKISLAIAAVSLFASASVMARSAVSYTYAGVQFINQDLDGGCNQDGVRLGGSLELNSDFFALGSYSDVSGNGCGSENLKMGIGYHTLFGADSSLYGALSAENISVDYGNSDSGLIVAAGLRGFIENNVELKVELAHHTAFDGNTVLSGGIAYWFAPTFSVTGDVGLGSESSELALGLRMNF
ncbi:porin family protein [Cellvibrio sp. OA-2007]|uniref:porin family protein n=1 Tax=Cellvibrio sp. OA-2007 TaxID=529823 RepID=UPI001EE6BE7B|nr:porin family protein [Cellvibrio sp. OA-2007]